MLQITKKVSLGFDPNILIVILFSVNSFNDFERIDSQFFTKERFENDYNLALNAASSLFWSATKPRIPSANFSVAIAS